MTNTIKIIGISLTLFFTLFALFTVANYAKASITQDISVPKDRYVTYELFAQASSTADTILATTTSATSTNIVSYFDSNGRLVDGTADIRGAKKVTLYFNHGGLTSANTGTSTYRVQTSRDGTNWNDYTMLIPATSTSATYSYATVPQQIPASGAPATTTQIFFMESLEGGFAKLRCITVITGATEAGCTAAVTY